MSFENGEKLLGLLGRQLFGPDNGPVRWNNLGPITFCSWVRARGGEKADLDRVSALDGGL